MDFFFWLDFFGLFLGLVLACRGVGVGCLGVTCVACLGVVCEGSACLGVGAGSALFDHWEVSTSGDTYGFGLGRLGVFEWSMVCRRLLACSISWFNEASVSFNSSSDCVSLASSSCLRVNFACSPAMDSSNFCLNNYGSVATKSWNPIDPAC